MITLIDYGLDYDHFDDFTILIDYGHADVVTTLIDYCVDNDKC